MAIVNRLTGWYIVHMSNEYRCSLSGATQGPYYNGGSGGITENSVIRTKKLYTARYIGKTKQKSVCESYYEKENVSVCHSEFSTTANEQTVPYYLKD